MSKSKSSAAAVIPANVRAPAAPRLHSLAASKGAARPAAHGAGAAADTRGDDEFETEAPSLDGAGGDGEIAMLEEEFDLDAQHVEASTPELSLPKPPSDKEIEEGGGDSMLARYFREMATHPVMGPEEELKPPSPSKPPKSPTGQPSSLTTPRRASRSTLSRKTFRSARKPSTCRSSPSSEKS
jgi:hypothetical protein